MGTKLWPNFDFFSDLSFDSPAWLWSCSFDLEWCCLCAVLLISKLCHLGWTVLILGTQRSSLLCYCSDATLELKSLLLQHWNKNAESSPLNLMAKFSSLLHSHTVLSETLTSFYRLIRQEFSEQLVLSALLGFHTLCHLPCVSVLCVRAPDTHLPRKRG